MSAEQRAKKCAREMRRLYRENLEEQIAGIDIMFAAMRERKIVLENKLAESDKIFLESLE